MGIPISHSRMERITTASFSTARRTNGFGAATVPLGMVGQSASAAVAGSALCSRLPWREARNMTADA